MTDIVLGGRAFTPVNFDRRTVLIDHYLMREIRASGADKILPADGESSDVWLVRLQAQILHSGRAPQIIAGYLLPVGMTERDWTPEFAAETAKHIGLCDTQADRELVQELAAEVTVAFFRQGLASLMTFLSCFPESASPRGPKRKRAGRSILANGRRLFGRLRSSTPISPNGSSDGRSASF
jgi:hypothetical protein